MLCRNPGAFMFQAFKSWHFLPQIMIKVRYSSALFSETLLTKAHRNLKHDLKKLIFQKKHLKLCINRTPLKNSCFDFLGNKKTLWILVIFISKQRPLVPTALESTKYPNYSPYSNSFCPTLQKTRTQAKGKL